MRCSVAQCLEVVGEWWSMLIVRDAFLAVSRFDQFQERLGISRNVLNQRLAHLTRAEVLEKAPYSRHPAGYGYRLTEKAGTCGRCSPPCGSGATGMRHRPARRWN
jgi:DNA-binding HxlR family transcriptional regulator